MSLYMWADLTDIERQFDIFAVTAKII